MNTQLLFSNFQTTKLYHIFENMYFPLLTFLSYTQKSLTQPARHTCPVLLTPVLRNDSYCLILYIISIGAGNSHIYSIHFSSLPL